VPIRSSPPFVNDSFPCTWSNTSHAGAYNAIHGAVTQLEGVNVRMHHRQLLQSITTHAFHSTRCAVSFEIVPLPRDVTGTRECRPRRPDGCTFNRDSTGPDPFRHSAICPFEPRQAPLVFSFQKEDTRLFFDSKRHEFHECCACASRYLVTTVVSRVHQLRNSIYNTSALS